MGKTNPLNDNDLKEFVELQASFAESEKSWSIDIKDIDQDIFDLSVKNPNTPERKITQDGLRNSNAKLFPKGSLLIGMYDASALKMSIIDRDSTFNQAIAGVKPNDNIDLKFILFAINAIKSGILNMRRGVRQKNLSLSKIKSINISIPNLLKQREIVRKLSDIKAEICRLENIYQQKLTALTELKQSLLQKAFYGELTADDINTKKKAIA